MKNLIIFLGKITNDDNYQSFALDTETSFVWELPKMRMLQKHYSSGICCLSAREHGDSIIITAFHKASGSNCIGSLSVASQLEVKMKPFHTPVSYTHLTLPTIA